VLEKLVRRGGDARARRREGAEDHERRAEAAQTSHGARFSR
jgi:hypothetical protein